MLSKLTVLALVAAVARAERFQFNYNEAVPYVENQHGQRFMQVTQPECNPAGSLFICDNVGTTVRNTAGNLVAITATLVCPFSPLIQVDFRQAEGCSCEAQVATADGGFKKCACTLCPAGYGDNPISIDCDMSNTTDTNMTDANATGVDAENEMEAVDPFILDSCTSFDCDFRCNGTCKFGCDEVPLPEECFELCGTPQPTGAPAGGAAQPTSGAPTLSSMPFFVFSSFFMLIKY
ncbi:hypothetical protein FisN_7Hh176 [Fistulifera solaris]|jgi:hypothetical protein|uniref:Uncharacterized protein n=1 Tax=Fistulifera solaris TaxID=1519565 RepID=A0A1Z5K3R9_FISSO|nr:hypothetical protein FisN_7Hh176 [Fistulifera solaris]|eukprot:GAX20859.1 hypothetical protein FisN_7Hh176 [Fistulifera solaris]